MARQGGRLTPGPVSGRARTGPFPSGAACAMMHKVDLASILDVGKRPKELLTTLFVNGVVIPSLRPYSSGQ